MNTITVNQAKLIKILEVYATFVSCDYCPCNNTHICRNGVVRNGNFCDDGVLNYLTKGCDNK